MQDTDTTVEVETLAREAFYGGQPILDHYVRWIAGYKLDGVRYPSNGETLADYIAIVKRMAPANVARLTSANLAAEITRQSEYWGMMRADVWADMFGSWLPYPGELLY